MTEENKQPEDEVVQAAEVESVAPEQAEETEAAQPDVDLAADLAAARDELARVQKALAEVELRAQAEVQNIRRRLEMEVDKARKFALEKFSRDVLSVADSLERGLGALDKDNEVLAPAREGLELTLKQLLDVFGRFQIEQIDPAGAPFDPENHEAMTQIPYPGAEPNTVVDVLEKGYSLNGRLLRPARVVVAK